MVGPQIQGRRHVARLGRNISRTVARDIAQVDAQTDRPVQATVPGPVPLSIRGQTRPGDAYDNNHFALTRDQMPAVRAELLWGLRSRLLANRSRAAPAPKIAASSDNGHVTDGADG